MGANSVQLSDFPIVDDSKAHSPEEYGRGYVSRDYSEHPLGDGLKSGAEMPTLSKESILERLRFKTAHKRWVTDRCDAAGLTVKNQRQTSLCWGNAPTHGAEVCYITQGGTKKVLSAASVTCRINGFRNQGGSGISAVKGLVKFGACTESRWGNTSFEHGLDNEENHKNAMLHRIVEYDDLNPHDNLAIQTRIVNDIPVTVGIPAWGHEVLIVALIEEGGVIYYVFDNSWGTGYGNNGRGVLRGRMAQFDEAGAIRSVTPSVN